MAARPADTTSEAKRVKRNPIRCLKDRDRRVPHQAAFARLDPISSAQARRFGVLEYSRQRAWLCVERRTEIISITASADDLQFGNPIYECFFAVASSLTV